ncbi:MAG TPA: pseudouridine synthase [Parafilimonas sp.]|nr:pseudouridine synthase [Parafilimonas sp.]
MKQHAFESFINKEKGSKKKEAIRQEKRKWKEARSKKYEERSNEHAVRGKRYETENKKFEIRNQKSETNRHGAKLKTETRQPAAGNQQPVTEMPLNKFIAHAGVCSRREAAELVKDGKVKVNGDFVYEPGFKVSSTDKVTFNNKQLHLQKNLVYILLNKPKDYITTAKDTHGRKTVFDLIEQSTDERVFPVGRLDRNTTGVLLLTNDGDLTQKLTHPSFGVKKVYEVKLDKPLQKKDFESLLSGIKLDDGFIAADAVAYADTKDKSVIGIEIHSGKNRIVRRMFEYLGYDVKNLDRVLFANLTKKNVDRGKWRFLNEKEVRLLKFMNQSFVKKKRLNADLDRLED